MLIDYVLGQTSIILRVKILDSSVSTGAGKTGLTSATGSLNISAIADNEATTTSYTSAGSTIESITTLGTFATPTATKCRFKELDSTSHKGVYEIQLDNTRYAVSSAKSLLVSISGAANAAETDVVIPLRSVNPYDGVHGGMSALPNTACTTNASLLTSGTGTDQISVTSGRIDIGKALGTAVTLDANNVLNVSAKYWGGTIIVASSIPVGTAAGAASGLSLVGSQQDLVNAPNATAVTAIQSGLATSAALSAVATNASTAATQSTSAASSASTAAALFTTQLTESYAANGAAPTPAQALFLIQQILTEFAISGTTVTIKKKDHSTTAATLTLDSSTAPTQATRAT